MLFHSASRAIGKTMPRGSLTSLLGPRINEDGDPEDVCVWIRPPPKKRKISQSGRDPIVDMLFEPIKPLEKKDDDLDWRPATLKWVPNSIEVHAIKQVTYTKDRHAVTRSVEPRKKHKPRF